MNWWELMQNDRLIDYGRDTRSWNRARILGVVNTFMALSDTLGEEYALWLMQATPAQNILDRLNEESTADNITIREE